MDIKKFAFEVSKTDGYAREGIIRTHRGDIHTPAFMPVGTQATVKACTINDIKKTNSEIILSNTYHLMIRPGVERIERVGGLHKFMNCDLPILTDSGGFQVMSLSKLNKIDREKGAIFNSHIDGKKFILSPERSIEIQLGLNSDICMIMDECPKNTKDYDLINKSVQKTGRALLLDTARKNGGVMAEVATNINEDSGDYLDGPILRVGSEDVPWPYNRKLEQHAMSSVPKIMNKIEQGYSL